MKQGNYERFQGTKEKCQQEEGRHIYCFHDQQEGGEEATGFQTSAIKNRAYRADISVCT